MNTDLIIVFLYSYLIGSIPFGLIITKLFLKSDIRKIGSGNIGATNVLRTGKKSLAASTLLFDVSKGYLSIYLTQIYFNDLVYLTAISCFIGHIFPVWLNFKGGKGIATYLGIILCLSFELAIVFGVTWLIIFFIFRYSSLSSIVSTLIVLAYSNFLRNYDLSTYLFTAFVIVLYTHRKNIIKLKNKKENKIKF